MMNDLNLKRINFNLDSALADKVDAYAKKLHVNRSAAMAVIISQFFDSQDMMKNLAYLAKVANEIKEDPADKTAE